MKKTILISITCLLAVFVAMAFWFSPGKASGGNEGTSRGYSVGFIHLAAGVGGDSLIPALERNGFKRVENRTFDTIVPETQADRSYVGLIAFRDTTIEGSNEFFLGVGSSDVIYYYESHSGALKSGKAWKDYTQKQMDSVKRMTSSPK